MKWHRYYNLKVLKMSCQARKVKQEGIHNTTMYKLTLMTCPVTAKAATTRPHATNAVVDTTAAGAMNPHVTHDVAIDNTQARVAPTVIATTNKTVPTLSPLRHKAALL